MSGKKKEVAVVEDGGVFVVTAGTPVYIRTADVCALTGKSNQWVGQLVNQGVIFRKQTSHGPMFELADTMKRYIEMIEARIEEKTERDSKAESEKKSAEASLKRAKATVATLEAAEIVGKMHRSEDVAALTEDMIYTFRASLMALPGRLAVQVADVSDKAEAAEIIRKEIFALMRELAAYEYDPDKYGERVRARMKKDALERLDDEDE